jgi:class 3 adenylate cyclase/tetratricopeptide (TPR) repeat protein
VECPSCRAIVDDGARFCSSCGQSLVSLGEERRIVTVLFADLVGFTSLSEHRDPEAVKRVVDSAFERLVRDVTAYGGRVDKIVGDAIVALFGAPVAHEDDAERAVRAGLRMQQTLAEYGNESGIAIRMRVGVHTGEVLVGALRAGGDYTAMGDVVNLASRLQTAAAPGEVLVGSTTHGATHEAIDYEERGHLTARGREQSEQVWAAIGTLRPPGFRRRRDDAPLVGRDNELRLVVESARNSIRHQRAQVVMLVGEAGVGKSRLAEEVAEALAAEDGVSVYRGRCLPYGEVNPWWPVAEVLRDACGIDPDAGVEAAAAATRAAVSSVVSEPAEVDVVVDGLLHVLGHESPLRGRDGAVAAQESALAIQSFLEGALRQGPVLVLVADLHWADDAVFDLIDGLLGRLARQPLVLVGTARRALQGRWSPGAGRFNSLSLNLDPLDRLAVSELLDHLSHDVVDERTRGALLDRSGGNPLYLQELVTLVDRHDVPLSVDASGLPETLRGLVAARIDALPADEQSVLSDASIWGASGTLAALDRIARASRGVPSVLAEARSLADKDVLTIEGQRWAFRSDVVREVTYARLTKSDRLKGHAGIAAYLDATVEPATADDGVVERVARHYLEAHRLAEEVDSPGGDALTERAAHWIAEAAERAERNGSWVLAQRRHSRVLELLADEATEARAAALLGRSRAEAEQWDYAAALADAHEALDLGGVLGSPQLRAEALLRVAAAEMRRGEWAPTEAALEEALELYDAAGDVSGRGETLRQLGLGRLLRGDHRLAEPPILGALEAFRTVRDRRGEGWALQNLAWIAMGDGRVERAHELLDASHTALLEVGDRSGIIWNEGLAAFVDVQRGDFESARARAQRVHVDSERWGDRFGSGMMQLVLGIVELWTGHPPAAEESARKALAGLRPEGDPVGSEQVLTLLGRALVMQGDIAGGVSTLREALHVGHRTSTTFAPAVAELTEAQVGIPGLVGAGDTAATVEAEAGSPPIAAPPSDSGPTTAGALLALLAGQVERATKDMAAARAVHDGPADRVAEGVVLAATGEADAAVERAHHVLADPRATYLDRVQARVLLGLLDRSVAGGAHIEAARTLLVATEDRLTPALVDLAEAVRGRFGSAGESLAMAEAEARLASVGIERTRWREVFGSIVQRAPGR